MKNLEFWRVKKIGRTTFFGQILILGLFPINIEGFKPICRMWIFDTASESQFDN